MILVGHCNDKDAAVMIVLCGPPCPVVTWWSRTAGPSGHGVWSSEPARESWPFPIAWRRAFPIAFPDDKATVAFEYAGACAAAFEKDNRPQPEKLKIEIDKLPG